MPFGSLGAQQRITVLLELLGGPKYAAQMRANSAETRAFGRATATAGRESQLASRRTWMMNQALYTMRRYAFYGTLAVSALAVGVAKLGYSYLSSMQTARVALSPVIKNTRTLNGYLNQLFQISKFSPFVISDLALSFRQLYFGFRGTNVGAQQIIRTMRNLTDYMSAAGKTGPGQLNRVTLALQHMAYQGRLTGRAVYQLGQLGIPIYHILQGLGISRDMLSKVSSLNVDPMRVLEAINRYAETTTGIHGAARRISLQTVPGLLQVLRDTTSQISGHLIQGAYRSSGGGLRHLLLGPLNQISNINSSRGTILAISKMMTGHTGLGQGFLLLMRTAGAFGRVFLHIVVPAFVMGMHALIVFYPLLQLLNISMRFAARHATIFKIVLAALAAEFIITHAAASGLWLGMKFFRIATFGAIPAVKRLIGILWILRKEGFAGLTKEMKIAVFWGKIWNYGTKTQRIAGTAMWKTTNIWQRSLARLVKGLKIVWGWTVANTTAIWGWIVANRVFLLQMLGAAGLVGLAVILYIKWKPFRDLMNKMWKDLIYFAPLIGEALYTAFGPLGVAAGALLLLIRYWNKLHQITGSAANNPPRNRSGGIDWGAYFNPLDKKFWHIGFPFGGFTGPSPHKSTPIQARTLPSATTVAGVQMSGAGAEHWQPINIHIDGKKVASAVAKAQQDKQARR